MLTFFKNESRGFFFFKQFVFWLTSSECLHTCQVNPACVFPRATWHLGNSASALTGPLWSIFDILNWNWVTPSHIILCIILFCTTIPLFYKFKSCSRAVGGVLQLSVSCLAFCCGAGKLKNICRQGQSSLLFFREYLQSFIRLGPIPTPILDAMSTDLSPESLTSIACITI